MKKSFASKISVVFCGVVRREKETLWTLFPIVEVATFTIAKRPLCGRLNVTKFSILVTFF